MKHKTTQASAIATCAIALTAGNEIQLFPAGEFRAADGRPKGLSSWRIDATLAAALIAEVDARTNDLVLDYEHQTMLTAENGQPAPAAGWFKSLEWRAGDGLYAIDVRWTERATAMIEAGEYRYISPVFAYDKKTGAVLRLVNAALTNNPALDGMDAVAASFLAQESPPQESLTMDIDELLNQLRWMLNLPALATAEEITAELQKAISVIKAGQADAAAAANFSLAALLAGKDAEISALKSAAPDPALYVPMAQHAEMQGKVAALTTKLEDGERSGLMVVALADGRILGDDQKAYWGAQPLAALKAFLAVAQPVAALVKMQSEGKALGAGGLNLEDSKAIATAACKHQAEQAAIGINLTTVQAVAHVTKPGV